MSGATSVGSRLRLADEREVAGLGAFLARLLRYDRAAVVRLRTAGQALAVFGRVPLGEPAPLAVRPARLAGDEELDATLSAGQVLDALEEARLAGAAEFALPPGVTGPAWAGLLPPRSGWQPVGALRVGAVAGAVAAGVAEFRTRGARPGADADAVAGEIWSRPLDGAEGLPLRAAHAAQVLGFLVGAELLSVHRHQAWLRLATPGGSVAVRRGGAPGAGLGLTVS